MAKTKREIWGCDEKAMLYAQFMKQLEVQGWHHEGIGSELADVAEAIRKLDYGEVKNAGNNTDG